MPTWHEGLASARDASLSHNKMPFPVSAASQVKVNAKRAPEMSPVKRAAKRACAAAPPLPVASGDPVQTPASPEGERLERSASDQVRARAAPVHAVETPSSGGPGTPLNPVAAPNGGGMRTLQAPVSVLSPGGGQTVHLRQPATGPVSRPDAAGGGTRVRPTCGWSTVSMELEA